MTALRHLSVRAKILLGFGTAGFLTLALALLALWSLDMARESTAALARTSDVTEEFLLRDIDHHAWLNRAASAVHLRRASLGVETDPTRCELGRWLDSAAAGEAQDLVPELAGLIPRIREEHRHLHELGGELDDRLAAGDGPAALEVWQSRVGPAAEGMLTLMSRASDAAVERTEVVEAASVQALSRARLLFVAGALLCVLLVFAVALPLVRSIGGAVQHLKGVMADLRAGRLDARAAFARSDEFGELGDGMDALAGDLQTKVLGTLDRLARGDLDVEIASKAEGDQIAPTLLRIRQSLAELLARTRELVDAGRAGRLDHRADAGDLEGGFRDVVEGLNELLDTSEAPLNEMLDVVRRLARRDLTARAAGDYAGYYREVTEATNQAAENLDAALKEVSKAAEQVAGASGQISSGAQALAESSSEQAAGLEEIGATMATMATRSAQTLERLEETGALSRAATDTSRAGVDEMAQLAAAVERIRESSDATGKVVKTIDEIAFQTNLLALNAAVEAARAGEAGKGFAVVAEEVRNLAIRSAEAAKGTADLIHEAIENARAGVEVSGRVTERLREIDTSVSRVGAVTREMVASGHDQNAAVEETNRAVEQLSTLTQGTAASAEESASAAEELDAQSAGMRGLVGSFSIGADGWNRRATPTAAPSDDFVERGAKPGGAAPERNGAAAGVELDRLAEVELARF